MTSDCSSRFSSDWRSERIPIVTLSKSINSAALGAWAGGSLWTGRGKWACCCGVMWRSGQGARMARACGSPAGPNQGHGTAQAGHFGHYVDRKSTRLNSSHSQISYAVFCLKKKTESNVHDDADF